jgi:hypothetical protein
MSGPILITNWRLSGERPARPSASRDWQFMASFHEVLEYPEHSTVRGWLWDATASCNSS